MDDFVEDELDNKRRKKKNKSIESEKKIIKD